MICEECNSQYELEAPVGKKDRFLGLCRSCGTERNYGAIFKGYIEGAGLTLVSGIIFYSLFMGFKITLFIVAGLFIFSIPIYLVVKMQGDIYHPSTESRKNHILRLEFFGCCIGLGATLTLFFIGISLFR